MYFQLHERKPSMMQLRHEFQWIRIHNPQFYWVIKYLVLPLLPIPIKSPIIGYLSNPILLNLRYKILPQLDLQCWKLFLLVFSQIYPFPTRQVNMREVSIQELKLIELLLHHDLNALLIVFLPLFQLIE